MFSAADYHPTDFVKLSYGPLITVLIQKATRCPVIVCRIFDKRMRSNDSHLLADPETNARTAFVALVQL